MDRASVLRIAAFSLGTLVLLRFVGVEIGWGLVMWSLAVFFAVLMVQVYIYYQR